MAYRRARICGDNPWSNLAYPRADAAYERALAAFREKSYEVARRWVLEALAHNKQHAGARALLATARRGALVGESLPGFGPRARSHFHRSDGSHQSGESVAPAAESIDPTIMPRGTTSASSGDTDAASRAVSGRESRSMPRPAADQTVIGPPKSRAPLGRTASSLFARRGAAVARDAAAGGGAGHPPDAARQQRAHGSRLPVARGALIARRDGCSRRAARLVTLSYRPMVLPGRPATDDHEAERRHHRRPGHRVWHWRHAVLDDDHDGRSDRARDAAGQGLRVLQRLHRRLRARRAALLMTEARTCGATFDRSRPRPGR